MKLDELPVLLRTLAALGQVTKADPFRTRSPGTADHAGLDHGARDLGLALRQVDAPLDLTAPTSPIEE